MTEPFRCILADPPWRYGDKLTMDPSNHRGADAAYKTTMSTDGICALACGGHAKRLHLFGYPIADDAVLALWVTGPFLLNGDGPRVCRAWGFEPKQLFTWVKGDLVEDAIIGALGMGHTYRVDTEHLILAKRGSPPVMRHDLRNYVFLDPKTTHSAKPESVVIELETLTPGPYLELFARRPREGWTCVGDELTVDAGDRI